jgi:polyphosphate kinase 2
MSKSADRHCETSVAGISKKDYEKALYELQVELVKLQSHLIANNLKVLVLFEGRDAAGKDGTIKRIAEHLSPRETRVVALGKPSDRECGSWYFQRFVPHLPAAQEMVLFNRSWYNRAGVEKVMGFCSEEEYRAFMVDAPHFEHMLIRGGLLLFKYYLDVSRREQEKRLKDRERDPLKQWKTSPVDQAALKHWDDYSQARNQMLTRSHTAFAPWRVVRADDKRQTRLNVIRDLLAGIRYKGRNEKLLLADPGVVFEFDEAYLANGMIAP